MLDRVKNYLFLNKQKLLIFLVFLGISLYYTIGNGIFPSMDGASHMHNATLLKNYISGNQVVRQNFVINSIIIPNIFSSYLITFLLIFFNSEGAIFSFQLIHYILFFLAFYYFLNSFGVRYSGFLSLIAVLFFNSFLFNLGFYNFSFSIIFLIFLLGFYHKNFRVNTDIKWVHYFILLIQLFLLYYSNALGLLIFLFYLFLFESNKTISLFKLNIKWSKTEYKHLIALAIVVTPFLILTWLFQTSTNFQHIPFFTNNLRNYFSELIDFKSFIVYQYDQELVFVRWISVSVATLLVFTVFKMVRNRFNSNGAVLFLMSLVTLLLYFIVPDNYSVGMMSPRFLNLFYLFIILWLLIQETNILKYIVVTAVIILVFFERDRRHIHALNALNKDAKLVKEVSFFIKPNSVVLPIYYGGNWLEPNFNNYLGVDKPIIILGNYEANLGWFPLKWNLNAMPKYLLGESENVDGAYACINPEGKPKVIDYVFIFGDRRQIGYYPEFKKILEEKYQRIVTAENALCSLYKLKSKVNQ